MNPMPLFSVLVFIVMLVLLPIWQRDHAIDETQVRRFCGGIRRCFRILPEYLANSRWVGGISSRSQTNFRGDQVLEHIA